MTGRISRTIIPHATLVNSQFFNHDLSARVRSHRRDPAHPHPYALMSRSREDMKGDVGEGALKRKKYLRSESIDTAAKHRCLRLKLVRHQATALQPRYCFLLPHHWEILYAGLRTVGDGKDSVAGSNTTRTCFGRETITLHNIFGHVRYLPPPLLASSNHSVWLTFYSAVGIGVSPGRIIVASLPAGKKFDPVWECGCHPARDAATPSECSG